MFSNITDKESLKYQDFNKENGIIVLPPNYRTVKDRGVSCQRPKKSPPINLMNAKYRPTSHLPPSSLTAIKQSQAGCKSTGLMFWSRYVDQEQESQKEGEYY
jgi:hypothetical protein